MEAKVSLGDRPDNLSGSTYKYDSGCGSIYITLNVKDDKIYEVFLVNKSGCTGLTEALARITSLFLREGGSPSEIIQQLKEIKCVRTEFTSKINCSKALALAINKHLLSLGDQNGE